MYFLYKANEILIIKKKTKITKIVPQYVFKDSVVLDAFFIGRKEIA